MKALQAACIVGAITFTGMTGAVVGAELGSVPGAGFGPSLMALGLASIETKSVDLGHHDVARPVPVTQDFRYLIYYVWSDCRLPRNRRTSS